MTWQRTDGTLLAMDAASHRDALEQYFTAHSIPAVLEFHPSAPYLVGVRLYVNDDGRVATAGARLLPGLELEDLAEDISERFGLDVLVGEIAVEDLEDDGEMDLEDDESPEDTDSAGDDEIGDDETGEGRDVRVLTITSAPDEYLPSLARAVGEPIMVAPAGANALVLTESGRAIPGLQGFAADVLPVVQLLRDGADRSVVAYSGNDAPTTLTWGTTIVVVTGTPDPSDEVRRLVEALASNEDDARAIASVTAAGDVDRVRAALDASPEEGLALLVEALGLPREATEFLEGDRPAAEVPGAREVEPAGPVAALRTSLGSAADDVSELRLVEFAESFEEARPVAARSLSVAQGVAGAVLLARAARAGRSWRAAGVTTGVLLLADALGELALYEWFRRRRAADVTRPPS